MGRVRAIFTSLIDVVFPRHCVQCSSEGSLLCTACAKANESNAIKIELFSKGGLQGLLSSFSYSDPVVRKLIKAWKYHFDQSAWEHLKEMMRTELEGLQRFCEEQGIQAIVPVPLHNKRFCERGFDQSSEIAVFLSEQLRIPVVYALTRRRGTGRQTDRTHADRKIAMLRNPFSMNTSLKGYKKVLLIDDVWTTGSTSIAAANVLHREGVNVWAYTLAKGNEKQAV